MTSADPSSSKPFAGRWFLGWATAVFAGPLAVALTAFALGYTSSRDTVFAELGVIVFVGAFLALAPATVGVLLAYIAIRRFPTHSLWLVLALGCALGALIGLAIDVFFADFHWYTDTPEMIEARRNAGPMAKVRGLGIFATLGVLSAAVAWLVTFFRPRVSKGDCQAS